MKALETSNAPPRGESYKAGRRGDLLAAADRAIRRAGPRTSMDDIAAEAGVSRVVLYRYFDDKAGLYAALVDRYSTELMKALRRSLTETDDPRLRLERTITTYVDFIESNEELYDFLMHRAVKEGPGAQATVSDFMRRVAEEVGTILSDEIRSLGLDPAPAPIWANGVVGMVHLATDWWMQTRGIPREKFVAYLLSLLSYGFFGLAADPELALEFGIDPRGAESPRRA